MPKELFTQLFRGTPDPAPLATLHDPVLGPLACHVMHGAHQWVGEWVWPPTGRTIEIGLPGTPTEPSPMARALLLAMQAQAEVVMEAARPSLRAWRASLRRPAHVDPFSVMSVVGMWIDQLDETQPWSLDIDSPEGIGHGIELYFAGLQVTHMQVDS